MTVIPLNFNQADPQKNLARSIVALLSIAAPSGNTPAILGPAAGTPPVKPVLLAATTGSPGVKGSFNAFGMIPKVSDPTKTTFWVELPYSVKVFALTLDQRKSILPLGNLVPIIKPLVSPVAMTTPPANLEQYAYDQAIAIAAAQAPGQKAEFKQAVDPLTGRTFLAITGTLDASIETLLAETVASPN
jgi:hypothetical protein